MKFVEYSIPKIEQINTDSGRFYRTPEGNLYPSVTTILSTIPNEHLEAWKKAVGEQEANKVAKIAADKGTRVHECCENYILGITNKFSIFELDEKEMFNALIPHLNKFQEIHGMETRLYSDKLKVAGTVDMIAKIDGKMYIVDYKTSSRLKTREEISSYFMQCSVYALAFYELTGVVVPNIRILMTVKHESVLVFDEKVSKWAPKFIEIRNSVL